MKRTRLLGVLVTVAFAALALAGCTGPTTDGSTAGTSTSEVASAMSPASSAGPTQSGAGVDPAGTASDTATSDAAASDNTSSAAQGSSPAETTSTVIPAELDSQSATWFAAVCQQMQVDVPVAAGDLPPQLVIDYVRAVSAAMTATAQVATTVPPPTVEGGPALASALAASMSSSGADLDAKVESYLAEMEGVNPYSAKSAVLSKQLALLAAFDPLTSMDPAVKAALHQFPACQTYGF